LVDLSVHFRRGPIAAWLCGVVLAAMPCGSAARCQAQATSDKATIRCAVIGGMTDTGFWPAICERFERATGIHAEVVATGPKHVIAPVFRRGDVDLITMHASDTIINLVADGFAADPQPWAKNDLLIVGPSTDPAKITGEGDAVRALAKIIESKSRLLIHSSLGASEVLHDVLSEGDLELDLEHTTSLPSDKHRQLLKRAAAEGAYTLVGRIPFLNGKIENEGLVVRVGGDRRLRRPYVVAVRNAPGQDARQQAARQLAAFLRAPETQAWIADFGRGVLDDGPLFFPVVVSPVKKQ
jgi:tungstate transport system substrate-binding protein